MKVDGRDRRVVVVVVAIERVAARQEIDLYDAILVNRRGSLAAMVDKGSSGLKGRSQDDDQLMARPWVQIQSGRDGEDKRKGKCLE